MVGMDLTKKHKPTGKPKLDERNEEFRLRRLENFKGKGAVLELAVIDGDMVPDEDWLGEQMAYYLQGRRTDTYYSMRTVFYSLPSRTQSSW